MSVGKEMRVITTTLRNDQRECLRILEKKEDRPMAWHIRKAIQEYLDKNLPDKGNKDA